MTVEMTATAFRLGGSAGLARDTIAVVLNVNQAAEALGLTPIWVRKLAAAGKIKAIKIGRDWIIKPADLERFAKSNRPGPGHPTRAQHRRNERLKAARKG